MVCRLCQEQPGPRMTIMQSRAVSAICVRCGSAVCSEHGQRSRSDNRITCALCLSQVESAIAKGPAHA